MKHRDEQVKKHRDVQQQDEQAKKSCDVQHRDEQAKKCIDGSIHAGNKENSLITISVCMIVKNEQEVLKRCLDSLRPVADELILVDTGSTDATKEIAAAYTDRIYDFVWCDDFSAARNFAFSKANCDYIYSADADEILDDINIQKFRELKQSLIPEIEIVQFLYTNQLEHNTTYNFDTELRPKLYKRLREFVWVDPLHEAVRREPVVYNSDIAIIHKPLKPHGTRDFSIFQKTLAREGKLSNHLRGMYARELFIAGDDADFAAAAEYFEQVLEQPESTVEVQQEALCVLARAALGKMDVQSIAGSQSTNSFFKATIKALALGEPPSEICYLLGLHFEAIMDYNEAAVWFYNAAYETKPILDIRTGKTLPLNGLIRAKRASGKEAEACELEQQLAEQMKQDK